MANRKGKNPFREAIPFIFLVGMSPKESLSKFTYVCGAINQVARNKTVSRYAADKALQHIRNCLGEGRCEYATVGGWLHGHVGVSKHLLTISAIQEYRVRWLNHMADQWDRGEICK